MSNFSSEDLDSQSDSRRSSYSLRLDRAFPTTQSPDSSRVHTEADPWTAYKAKLDREIAQDSEKLMRLRGKEEGRRGKAGEMRLGKGDEARKRRDLSEESKEDLPVPVFSGHLEVSETALETAKFQDLQELQTRIPPQPIRPAPMLKTEGVDTPQQPGEPIVNRLQRTFKATQRVPKELLAGQSIDGLRHIIEILISDKQNLQDQLSADPAKSVEDFSPGEDLPFSASLTPNHSFTTAQSGSVMRQRMFPIRREGNTEERMRRTNNQSIYQKPVKREPEKKLQELQIPQVSDSPRPLPRLMKTFDSYEAEILKLTLEIDELKAKNALQSQVLRLSPEKRKIVELTNQMQARLQQQAAVIRGLVEENAGLKVKMQGNERQSSGTVSRAASPVGSAFQGGSQFFQYEMDALSSVHRASPRPTTLPPDDPLSLKPEERQVLNLLLELQSSSDPKRFDDYLSALLSKHEISDIVGTLVRYIRSLEDEVFEGLRTQVLELKVKATVQDRMYQDAMNEKARAEVEVGDLRASLDELRKELDRVNSRFQIEMRRNQADAALAASKSTARLLKGLSTPQSAQQSVNLYLASITKSETKEPYKLMQQKGTFSPWSSTKKVH